MKKYLVIIGQDDYDYLHYEIRKWTLKDLEEGVFNMYYKKQEITGWTLEQLLDYLKNNEANFDYDKLKSREYFIVTEKELCK